MKNTFISTSILYAQRFVPNSFLNEKKLFNKKNPKNRYENKVLLSKQSQMTLLKVLSINGTV